MIRADVLTAALFIYTRLSHQKGKLEPVWLGRKHIHYLVYGKRLRKGRGFLCFQRTRAPLRQAHPKAGTFYPLAFPACLGLRVALSFDSASNFHPKVKPSAYAICQHRPGARQQVITTLPNTATGSYRALCPLTRGVSWAGEGEVSQLSSLLMYQ